MEAIRTIKKVMNHQILIDVPEFLEEQEVEIIIFPHSSYNGGSSLSQLLLNGPVWSKKDVQDFEQSIQRGYENWTINGF